ncbi:MAG TPA: 3'-5' exonuclease [Burkholderiales bacterium]|nr:3'-5' exonuclease [Burkholderiales bacterium]
MRLRWFRSTPLAAARWVVLDCETSGLDATRDRLLSVGAVTVRAGRIALGSAFEARVRQETPSARENILVHGLGADAQRAGRPGEEVIAALAAYAADAVPVAFHAPFDAEVLRRHGLRLGGWIDLARLAPALFPQERRRTLDEWLAAFGIEPVARHDAAGDALAAAELLLALLGEAKRQRLETVEALVKAERSGRWLAAPA